MSDIRYRIEPTADVRELAESIYDWGSRTMHGLGPDDVLMGAEESIARWLVTRGWSRTASSVTAPEEDG
jgi:hypothetical protein